MQPGIQNKLRQALSGRDTVEMGQFKWVNLDMVRKEAGDDWNRLRRKIYNVSAHFIERRLRDSDVVLRCQGGFLLIFADLDEVAAAEKVEEISLAMNVFFLGDRILRKLKIEADAQSITPEEFLKIVAISGPLEEQPPVDRDALPADIDEDVGEGRLAQWKSQDKPPPEEDKESWRKQEQAEAGKESPNWTEAETVHRTDKPPHWEEVRVRRPKAAPIPLPEAVFVESSGQWDDLVFRPWWDARNSMISVHFCLARRRHRGQVLYGRDTLLGNDEPDLHRELDRSVAIAAQRAFQQRYAEGQTCPIGIPVHYGTIAKVSDRMDYFSILQSVPQKLRRYFYFRVDGIPAGAPVSQMQEIFRSMKGFGSSLSASVGFGDEDLQRFEGCGINLFGCELPAVLRRDGLSDENVAQVYNLVASVQALQADSYLTLVDDFETLEAALSAGVRYLSGEAIGESLALPAPAQGLSLADIKSRFDPPEEELDIAFI